MGVGRERYYAWGSMTTAEAVGTFIGRLLLWGSWLIGLPYVIWWIFTQT